MNNSTIDYKKELEAASKGMIMVHDPNLLIKLILRMIVGKVMIQHAGMILHDPERDFYTLSISRGQTGIKIPAGFARLSKDNPIIQLFAKKEYRPLTVDKKAIIAHDLNKLIWHESVIEGDKSVKALLHDVGEQMTNLNAIVCVPAYYRDELLAILLLGEKKEGGEFEQGELDFFSALASDAAMAIRNAQLFEELKRESERNHDLFIRATIVLGSTIEAKDKYTHGHTERVTNYAVSIAHQMINNGSGDFSPDFLQGLYIAGMLHDIGKIGVPEGILNKPGKLTPEEFEVMKKHPFYGGEILAPLPELKESLLGVKYHHERYDGKGYPEGLKGDEIPIIAMIVAVADIYDAMTTDRPYRKALSREVTIDEIEKNIGTQFHPKPAQAMIELFKMGKV